MAIHYLQEAANKNFSLSMVSLATIYLQSYKDNQNNQDHLKSALFWLEKAHALKYKPAAHYLNIAQGYLNQKNAETEEDDSQLEQLLQETENCISVESQSSSFENRLSSKKNQQEELTALEEEKATSLLSLQNKTELKEDQKAERDESNEKDTSVSDDEFVYKKGNIKQIRANLHQMASLRKEREATQSQTSLKLSPDAQEIANAIKNNEAKNLNNNDLLILFKDPAFQSQIEMTPTKSGLLISAHNRTTNQHISTSTHRKHTGSYKGMHPAFVRDLKDILDIFPQI
ncbi:MAG: hypothetical protein ACRYGR_09645 [Janthinobacterium lividum]